jgi:hypothetical protein
VTARIVVMHTDPQPGRRLSGDRRRRDKQRTCAICGAVFRYKKPCVRTCSRTCANVLAWQQRDHQSSRLGRKPTHGKTGTSEYMSWRAMLSRCGNGHDPAFSRYGGRGIVVCERWRKDFATFLMDMGPRPSPRHSIDRIDNDGNYEPGNCRWVTAKEQNRNRRDNHLVTIRGKTQCVADWAIYAGIREDTLRVRLFRLGWEPERAITQPVAYRRPRSVRR